MTVTEEMLREYIRWAAPPPPPRSMLEFSKSIFVPDPAGGTPPPPPIPYNPAWHPAHYAILCAASIDRLSTEQYLYYTILGPVQDGKTLVSMIIPVLYYLIERAQNVVYATPDMLVSSKQWSAKLRQTIIDSGWEWLLPASGTGSKNGGIGNGDIPINNGAHLYLMGAGGTNEAGQAAITAIMTALDEFDAIKAHLAQAIRKRTASYDMEARDWSTTTIKHDGQGTGTKQSAIMLEYEDSTRCRIAMPCPKCGEYQVWEFNQVTADYTSDDSAIQTARMTCQKNRCVIKEADRMAMVTGGKAIPVSMHSDGTWTKELLPSKRFGMRWWALESPLKSLGKLCLTYRKAMSARDKAHDHEPMRQFYRDELALPYIDVSEDTGTSLPLTIIDDIASKATYSKGDLPDPVDIVIGAIDNQLRSLYDSAWGFWKDDKGVHGALIDYSNVYFCDQNVTPDEQMRQMALEAHLKKLRAGYPHKTGAIKKTVWTAVDTAFRPKEVRPWVAKNRYDVLSIRGAGQDLVKDMRERPHGKVILRIPNALEVREQEGQPDRLQGFVDVTALGDYLAQGMRNGLILMPHNVDPSYARSILGVRKDPATGAYVPVHTRHDYWDLAIYALAMAFRHYETPKMPAVRYGNVNTPTAEVMI